MMASPAKTSAQSLKALLEVMMVALLFASYLLPIVLYPAISCVVTLMYYDLRVRREAFDLQMLSQQLGG